MDKQYRATLVSHTHWDRAWYVTFQEYRIRLIRLVDRLLKLLEEDLNYTVYMLDGQMIVLEDYLEVRPERAEELQELCRSGRIQVGPWYVLADEFLVSPEALIRNMMLGHRMGEDYGGVTKLGYVPDGFGHIAQLPQIFQGFDIDSAIFWRGMGAEGDELGTEFEWIAPDGSQVTTVLMPWGYHNISNLGYAIHWGDTSQMEFDDELALSQIRNALENIKPMCNVNALLLMNGIDHAEPETNLSNVVVRANSEIADTEIKIGTLTDHLNQVRDAGKTLPTFSGEFRWGRYSEILQGVYATRIGLKQVNQEIETLLERYLEPLTSFAWLSGADIPEGTPALVWTAWRWLLKNHPHDDIYGSGIDEVHHEMKHRFSQSEQIGRFLVRDSVRQIGRMTNTTRQSGTPILIYNPLNWTRQEMVEAEIDFEFDDPTADDFQIINGAGQILPIQILDDEIVFWMETLKANRKRRVKVAFPVPVPACGYTTVYAQARSVEVVKIDDSDWRISENGAENSHLSFKIATDGSLTVIDKATGHTYDGLHNFVDVEDAGDEYTYCPAPESRSVSTAGGNAKVTIIESGSCLVRFQVEQMLQIPSALEESRQRRMDETVTMPIVSTITLFRDQPGLFIETEIDNAAKDHKLTVTFPVDLNPVQVHVDEAFMVMARDIDLPASEGWVEDPTPLMHQRAFTDVSDGERGLAILNRGLPAVEVTRLPDDAGTKIAPVLLRSVGWLSRDDLSVRRIAAGPLVPTPGAQCLGKHRFEYAILPHAGDWQQVYQAAYGYNAPTLARRADTHEGLDLREMNITRDDPAMVKAIAWPDDGPNSDELSFLQIEPAQLVISAVRRNVNGDSLIVRFYNVSGDETEAKVSCWQMLNAAYRVNMNEERQAELTVQDEHTISIPVKGHEVITVELQIVETNA
jgi:mannosylglycerate hydrolase